MMTTVSISQFRQDLSKYLAYVQGGATVVVKDEKTNQEMAEVIGKKTWDSQAYIAMLDRVAGTFTVKNHPEWATKKKVEQWLRKSRLADERTFDVHT